MEKGEVDIVTLYSNDSFNTTESPLGEASPDDLIRIAKILLQEMIPVVFGIICVLGLFGNSIVITMVLKDKQKRNTTNILVLSLAVADLFFILFCVPFSGINYALQSWTFGTIGCKATNYAMFVSAYASVYTLVAMSLDRYLAVVHAIKSMTWRNERNAWITVAVIWIIILCGNVPILQQFGVVDYIVDDKHNATNCYQVAALNHLDREKTFIGSFLFFGYIIPLGIIILLYGLMLKRLLCEKVPGGGTQSTQSAISKKRATRMVVVVVVVFAVCWLPIHVIFILEKLVKLENSFSLFFSHLGANCLSYANSCINPVLYFFLSGKFRDRSRKYICC